MTSEDHYLDHTDLTCLEDIVRRMKYVVTIIVKLCKKFTYE